MVTGRWPADGNSRSGGVGRCHVRAEHTRRVLCLLGASAEVITPPQVGRRLTNLETKASSTPNDE